MAQYFYHLNAVILYYHQFHKNFSAFINWISVRFYETDCTQKTFQPECLAKAGTDQPKNGFMFSFGPKKFIKSQLINIAGKNQSNVKSLFFKPFSRIIILNVILSELSLIIYLTFNQTNIFHAFTLNTINICTYFNNYITLYNI